MRKGPPDVGGPLEWFKEVGRLDVDQTAVHLLVSIARGCPSEIPPKLFRHLFPIPFLTLDHLLYIC